MRCNESVFIIINKIALYYQYGIHLYSYLGAYFQLFPAYAMLQLPNA